MTLCDDNLRLMTTAWMTHFMWWQSTIDDEQVRWPSSNDDLLFILQSRLALMSRVISGFLWHKQILRSESLGFNFIKNFGEIVNNYLLLFCRIKQMQWNALNYWGYWKKLVGWKSLKRGRTSKWSTILFQIPSFSLIMVVKN